jgi:hypothetical protein
MRVIDCIERPVAQLFTVRFLHPFHSRNLEEPDLARLAGAQRERWFHQVCFRELPLEPREHTISSVHCLVGSFSEETEATSGIIIWRMLWDRRHDRWLL